MKQFDDFEKFLQEEFEHFEAETSEQSWEQIRAKLHPESGRRIVFFWLLPFFALLTGAYFLYSRSAGQQVNNQVNTVRVGDFQAERTSPQNDQNIQPVSQLSPNGSTIVKNQDYVFSGRANASSAAKVSEKKNISLNSAPRNSTYSDVSQNNLSSKQDNRAGDIAAANPGAAEAVNTTQVIEEKRVSLTEINALAALWPADILSNNKAVLQISDSRSIIKPVGRIKNKGVRLTGSIGLCSSYQILSANSADHFYVSNVIAPDPLSINRMGIQASIGLKFQLTRQLALRPSLNYQGIRRNLDYLIYENELKSWSGVSFGNSYELSDIEFKNTQIKEHAFHHSFGLQADLMWSLNKQNVLILGTGAGRMTGVQSTGTQWFAFSWQHRLNRYAVEPFVQYSTKKYAGLNKYYYFQPVAFGIKFGF